MSLNVLRSKQAWMSFVVLLTVMLIVFAMRYRDVANTEVDTLAPEFTGIEHWVNSSPLTMQKLRGKVVIVEFWASTCVNCLHALPHSQQWYDRYKDQGLVVVGVHTPEFDSERSFESMQRAMQQVQINFPVAQDNQRATWNAYHNQYWPTLYLIDRRGHVVMRHVGEGDYADTEQLMRELLSAVPSTLNE